LRESGFVGLVVPVAAIAPHVDDDIFFEPLAIGQCDVHHMQNRFRRISVHVENRNVDDLRHVGAIHSRLVIEGAGGEAHLVVDDEVDGAAGAIALELRKVESLSHDALPGKGGVAVHDEGEHHHVLCIPALGLFSTHLALHHGSHDFEMAGVGCEGKMHRVAFGRHHIIREALVIFDIAIAEIGFLQIVVFKF